MPGMVIARASRGDKPTIHGPSTIPNAFTGDVYVDPVLGHDGISVANVNFAPCARTYWHTHEKGQLLRVIAGAGWVCDKGQQPVKINVGDVIWCPAGTTHWHGADDKSYMVHQATSFGGVEWLDKVQDAEYSKKGSNA